MIVILAHLTVALGKVGFLRWIIGLESICESELLPVFGCIDVATPSHQMADSSSSWVLWSCS